MTRNCLACGIQEGTEGGTVCRNNEKHIFEPQEKSYEEFIAAKKAEDPIYDIDIWREEQIIKRINKMISELHKCARAVGRNPENRPLRFNMTLYFKSLDARQMQVPDPDNIPDRVDELDG